MKLFYFKIILLLTSRLLAEGFPAAMYRHATSSQSIVFHPVESASTSSDASNATSSAQNYGIQPKYEYKYEVSDDQTGDRKSHWETRVGDNVRGVYTVYEPDGRLRTVEYNADAIHGFNAVVKSEPSHHQQPRVGTAGYDSPSKSIHNRDQSPSQAGYLSERNISSKTFSSNNFLGYSGIKNSNNPGVDFRVTHVVKNNGDSPVKLP